MQAHPGKYLVLALSVYALGAPRGALAIDTPLSQNPAAMAISHGECANALDLVKRDIGSNNSQSVFIAGRMLDEGLCVKKDSVVATTFYARAAAMGDSSAQLDYAAKIGLGEGAAQDYANAGSQCRAAGLDPQKQLSDYALGYVCTVRAVTSRMLRESLPANTFQKTAGARARLEFNPVAGKMTVRASTPVTEGEPGVGSRIALPLVNIQKEVQKAWVKAVEKAAKPDAAQLQDQVVEVVLDLDLTMEQSANQARRQAASEDIRTLQTWDTIHTPMPTQPN